MLKTAKKWEQSKNNAEAHWRRFYSDAKNNKDGVEWDNMRLPKFPCR